MSNDLFDLNIDNLLTDEQRIAKINTFEKEKLCEIIVCNQYLGTHKELALACMQELANRRMNGEVFDFETYIEKSFKDLPKLEFSIPDISSVLRQFTGKKIL